MRRLGVLLFVAMILYFIFMIRQDIIDNLGLKREEQGLQKSLAQERQLAQQLRARLKNLSDRQYIEGLARTRLGLIKKGETAYKVILH